MKSIKWIAGNGQEAEVIHVTEEQNITDHTVMNKADHINIKLGGKTMIFQGLVNDEMIQVMGGKIRIPAEYQKEVIEMVKGVDDRRNARHAKNEKIDAEYKKHYKQVEKAMEE